MNIKSLIFLPSLLVGRQEHSETFKYSFSDLKKRLEQSPIVNDLISWGK